MIPVWIYNPTDFGVLYEVWTICDRGGQPRRQYQDLQLHTLHSLSVHRFNTDIAWTIPAGNSAMVQGQWYLYGHATAQTLECYVRHGKCVRGVDHPRDHIKILNYTHFTLWCYTDSRHKYIDLCPSIISQWSKDNDTHMDMLSHCCRSVIWCMDNVWDVWTTPWTTTRPPTSHSSLSGGTVMFEINVLNLACQ